MRIAFAAVAFLAVANAVSIQGAKIDPAAVETNDPAAARALLKPMTPVDPSKPAAKNGAPKPPPAPAANRLNADGTDPAIVAAKNNLTPMRPVPAGAAKPSDFEM